MIGPSAWREQWTTKRVVCFPYMYFTQKLVRPGVLTAAFFLMRERVAAFFRAAQWSLAIIGCSLLRSAAISALHKQNSPLGAESAQEHRERVDIQSTDQRQTLTLKSSLLARAERLSLIHELYYSRLGALRREQAFLSAFAAAICVRK